MSRYRNSLAQNSCQQLGLSKRPQSSYQQRQNQRSMHSVASILNKHRSLLFEHAIKSSIT